MIGPSAAPPPAGAAHAVVTHAEFNVCALEPGGRVANGVQPSRSASPRSRATRSRGPRRARYGSRPAIAACPRSACRTLARRGGRHRPLGADALPHSRGPATTGTSTRRPYRAGRPPEVLEGIRAGHAHLVTMAGAVDAARFRLRNP